MFVWLLAAVSLGFAWVLAPLGIALFWGVVAAIVFAPVYSWLLALLDGRRNLAAMAATCLVFLIVIVPLTAIAGSLASEAAGAYERLQAGHLDLAAYFRPVFDRLPDWARALLERLGLSRFEAVQDRITASFADSLQFLVGQAYSVGQSTFDLLVGLCVMLYGLFFLLRDGDDLSRRIDQATPLSPSDRQAVFRTLISAVRATVTGDFLVALVQGALGGMIFSILGIHAPLLWAALMAVLSLLPAIGAAFVWLPVAIYFLATGEIRHGVVLIAFGLLVIGLIDNLLRPILVGNATKLPDYLVLISTIGGIEVFGVQGFIAGPVIAALFVEFWRLQMTAARTRAEEFVEIESLSGQAE